MGQVGNNSEIMHFITQELAKQEQEAKQELVAKQEQEVASPRSLPPAKLGPMNNMLNTTGSKKQDDQQQQSGPAGAGAPADGLKPLKRSKSGSGRRLTSHSLRTRFLHHIEH